MKWNDMPGTRYTAHPLPLAASDDDTAAVAVCANPFEGASAYVYSAFIYPIATITGNNTNTSNFNLQLVAGTEIANKDYPTSTNGALGVADALTFTGTDAQRTIAAGGSVVLSREEVGTQPARIYGHCLLVGWRRI